MAGLTWGVVRNTFEDAWAFLNFAIQYHDLLKASNNYKLYLRWGKEPTQKMLEDHQRLLYIQEEIKVLILEKGIFTEAGKGFGAEAYDGWENYKQGDYWHAGENFAGPGEFLLGLLIMPMEKLATRAARRASKLLNVEVDLALNFKSYDDLRLYQNNWNPGTSRADLPDLKLEIKKSQYGSDGSWTEFEKKGSMTREYFAESILGYTEQADNVNKALSKGMIKFNLLNDRLFEMAYIRKELEELGGELIIDLNDLPEAFAYGRQIYINKNSETILSDIVHEGTYALDFRFDFVGTDFEWELRAYYFQNQFYEAYTGEPYYSSFEDVIRQLRIMYPD